MLGPARNQSQALCVGLATRLPQATSCLAALSDRLIAKLGILVESQDLHRVLFADRAIGSPYVTLPDHEDVGVYAR